MNIISLEACLEDLEAAQKKIQQITEDLELLRGLMLRYYYADAMQLLHKLQIEYRSACYEKQTIQDYIKEHYPAK